MHYSLISPLGEKLLPLGVVGLLMGGGSIVQLLLDVPAGYIMDRFGYLRFLKITTFIFLFAAVCILGGLTQNVYIWSIVLSTFGWLFFGPGVNAYILSHAPKESAGRFMSIRDVSGSIGVVLASAVLPFVLLFSPEKMGYVLLVLLGLAFIFLFASPKDRVSVHSEVKLATHHHYIKRHFLGTTIKAFKKLNPASGMLVLLQLAGSIFYGAVWFVVPLVIAHQASSGLLGVGLGMFDFAIVVLGFLFGNLADKSNKRTLVFFGLLLFSVGGILLGWNFGWLFLLFGFLATAGDEMAGLSLWSWLHSLDKEHAQDGTIAGVINLFQDLGWAIGPIVAGFLYEPFGATWTIVFGSVPIFLTWLAYQFFIHRHITGIPVGLIIPAKPHRHRHRT